MKSCIFSAAVLASLASAQSQLYGQCGGQGWTGATTCVAGAVCTYSNPYYSQCLPGSGKHPQNYLIMYEIAHTNTFSTSTKAQHDSEDNYKARSARADLLKPTQPTK